VSTLLNCGSSTTSTYQYSIKDEANNESSFLGIVEVTMEDNTPPVLTGVPPNVTINCNDIHLAVRMAATILSVLTG